MTSWTILEPQALGPAWAATSAAAAAALGAQRGGGIAVELKTGVPLADAGNMFASLALFISRKIGQNVEPLPPGDADIVI